MTHTIDFASVTPIAVMGAGAVGCYYGGMLARAGHDVVLVGRHTHVQAIQRNGLRVQAQSWDEHIQVAASTEVSALSGVKVVLFCVKSTDTESAALAMRDHLAPGATVLVMQNGVDNAQRLQPLLPQQEVVAAVVYVATEMAGPGHVRHHGSGELIIEPMATPALQNMLVAAGIPTEVSDNVRGELWRKLIVNCAYNALSAIARQSYGQLVRGEGVRAVMQDVITECLAVAHAEGVEVPGDAQGAVDRIARVMPGQQSSTAQDLARGKRSEIDHLNGLVVRRGEALGVPTPVNRTLHALVKLIETCSSEHTQEKTPLSAPPGGRQIPPPAQPLG